MTHEEIIKDSLKAFHGNLTYAELKYILMDEDKSLSSDDAQALIGEQRDHQHER